MVENLKRADGGWAGKGNLNFDDLIGGNIITDEMLAPFGGKMPKDPKDYRMFRAAVEETMAEITGAQNMGVFKFVPNCEGLVDGKPRQIKPFKPEHAGASFVYACDHVIFQDPVNPEGVVFIVLKVGSGHGYFLCKTCANLMQRHRLPCHLAIKMKCAKCVGEALDRIREKFPDRIQFGGI